MIICDEPVSALDVSIQAQVINLLMDLQEKMGLALVFISHNLAVVRHISHDVMVMCLGRVMETAPRDAFYARPLHPYSQALMQAVPEPDPRRETRPRRHLAAGRIAVGPEPAARLRLCQPLPQGRRHLPHHPPRVAPGGREPHSPPAISSRPDMTKISPPSGPPCRSCPISTPRPMADGRSGAGPARPRPTRSGARRWTAPAPPQRLTHGTDHFGIRDVSPDGSRLILAQSVHANEHDHLLLLDRASRSLTPTDAHPRQPLPLRRQLQRRRPRRSSSPPNYDYDSARGDARRLALAPGSDHRRPHLPGPRRQPRFRDRPETVARWHPSAVAPHERAPGGHSALGAEHRRHRAAARC